MPTVDNATPSLESIKAAIKMLDDCPVPRNDYQPYRNDYKPYGDTPVFTQKHYVAIAEVLHKQRKEIKQHEADQAARLEATNDVTLALCKLFKGDNPKFNDFQFIAACNRDLEGK